MANDRMMIVENGGHLVFGDSWSRNILNGMKRRMATTSNVPVSPALLEEEMFISQLVDLHREKLPWESKEQKQFPFAEKGKQKQITGPFTVSVDGNFLPMKSIYAVKSNRCHPVGITSPEGFNVTRSPNHWSNENIVIRHLHSEAAWISFVCSPPPPPRHNLTDHFQPLDLNVNGFAKLKKLVEIKLSVVKHAK